MACRTAGRQNHLPWDACRRSGFPLGRGADTKPPRPKGLTFAAPDGKMRAEGKRERRVGEGGVSALRVPKDGEVGRNHAHLRGSVMRINSSSHAHLRDSVMRINSPNHAHLQVRRCASIRKLLAGLESLSGIRNGLSFLENFCFRLSCVNFLPFIGLVRQLGRERAPESACREEGRDAAVLPRRLVGAGVVPEGAAECDFNLMCREASVRKPFAASFSATFSSGGAAPVSHGEDEDGESQIMIY